MIFAGAALEPGTGASSLEEDSGSEGAALEPGTGASSLEEDSGTGGAALEPGTGASSLEEDSGTGGAALEPGTGASSLEEETWMSASLELLDSSTEGASLELDSSLADDFSSDELDTVTLELETFESAAELEEFSPAELEVAESLASRESSGFSNSQASAESTVHFPDEASQKTPAFKLSTQNSSPEVDFSHFGKSFSDETFESSFFAELDESSEQASANKTTLAPKRNLFLIFMIYSILSSTCE